VTSLNSEDRSSSGDVVGVGDISSSSEVGRDTDVLNDLGETEEGLNVGVGEGVLAALRRVGDTGSLESGSQEGDVSGLIGGNLLEDRVNTRVTGGVERLGRTWREPQSRRCPRGARG